MNNFKKHLVSNTVLRSGKIHIRTESIIDKDSLVALISCVFDDFCRRNQDLFLGKDREAIQLIDNMSTVEVRVYFKDLDTAKEFIVAWDDYTGDFTPDDDGLDVYCSLEEGVRDYINSLFSVFDFLDNETDEVLCSKEGDKYYISKEISFVKY